MIRHPLRGLLGLTALFLVAGLTVYLRGEPGPREVAYDRRWPAGSKIVGGTVCLEQELSDGGWEPAVLRPEDGSAPAYQSVVPQDVPLYLPDPPRRARVLAGGRRQAVRPMKRQGEFEVRLYDRTRSGGAALAAFDRTPGDSIVVVVRVDAGFASKAGPDLWKDVGAGLEQLGISLAQYRDGVKRVDALPAFRNRQALREISRRERPGRRR